METIVSEGWEPSSLISPPTRSQKTLTLTFRILSTGSPIGNPKKCSRAGRTAVSTPGHASDKHRLAKAEGSELLRLLVDNVQDYAIFVLSPGGEVLTWNLGAKTLKGYERNEIVGKHFSIFYPREAIESGWPDRELALATKDGRFVDEGWRVRRDGSVFWASIVITALWDSENNLTGFAKITRDMTERRAAAERIQALNTELRKKVTELDESRRVVELRTLELQQLSANVLQIQDEERRRVARELHDEVGQQLAALKMILPEDASGEVNQLLHSAIASIRSLSYLLHPPLLDEAGLRAALHWLVDGVKTRSGIEIVLSIRPVDFPRLGDELETAVFRVIQEALTNVYRHAQSKSARIDLEKQSDWVVVRIRDYGKGLPLTGIKVGVGITGMRERLRHFGGHLTVSNAEPGTLVEVRIPILV